MARSTLSNKFFLRKKNLYLFANQIYNCRFACSFREKSLNIEIWIHLVLKQFRQIKKQLKKNWVVVDAKDKTLGRLASKVAILLRGKHKPNYTPHVDCGDYVIVINSKNIKLTGKKWEQKKYIRYTGYPGGQRSLNAKEQFEKNPDSIIEKAIKGMLPKNKLGANLFRNLYVYQDAEHKHVAQNPILINLSKF